MHEIALDLENCMQKMCVLMTLYFYRWGETGLRIADLSSTHLPLTTPGSMLLRSILLLIFSSSRVDSFVGSYFHPSTVSRLHVSESDHFADAALSVADAAASLRGKVVIVKYGGNAMTSDELKTCFCQDVAALQKVGVQVIVVHGGGPQISSMLETVGVETRFEEGFRVSTKEVVEVAEMVLCGSINKEISSKICAAGGRAIGLSGRDDSILQCVKQEHKDGYDLGDVGLVETVNQETLREFLELGICPVISPIGTGLSGDDTVYNVNADVAAGRIAGELKADRVLFLTDIAGVLDKEKNLIRQLHVSQVNELIEDETITGGMIPKVSYATNAVQLGVRGAFISDGRVPHALLKEVLGGGADGLGSGQGGTVVTL